MTPQAHESLTWFDGHLDLTYLALHGRDLARTPATCGGTLQPATVTFPSLAAAHVTRVISTLFVRQKTADATGPFCFTTPDEAYTAALHQIAMHHQWQREGLLTLAPSSAGNSTLDTRHSTPLHAILAIEGAACVRTPADLDIFHHAGVRMVSLTWAEGSPWAGGDQSGGDITPAGKDLIRHLDALHIIHDVSHLSERAFWTLLDIATGPIVASHSNCRALLPGARHPERHLSDEQIRALSARPHSKIGINLFARFILPPDQLARRRATIADLLTHIAHIEQLTARRDLVALGSDMDSGFGADLLPADLQGPAHLPRLAQALSTAGWSSDNLLHFANGWASLLSPTPVS